MHVVIFTGGVAPEPHDTVFYFSHAPAIDYVIAADSGLDTLQEFSIFYGNTYNFAPNIILGDMDSLKDKTLLQKYLSSKAELYEQDKDLTDTELALKKACKIASNRQNDLITLIGGSGGNIDHLIGIYDTFSTQFHADIWITSQEMICCVAEKTRLLVKNVTPEQRISVVRPTKSYTGGIIKTQGLQWESGSFRKEGMPSISNRISMEYYKHNKPIMFEVKEGTFLVTVPHSAILKKEMLCP